MYSDILFSHEQLVGGGGSFLSYGDTLVKMKKSVDIVINTGIFLFVTTILYAFIDVRMARDLVILSKSNSTLSVPPPDGIISPPTRIHNGTDLSVLQRDFVICAGCALLGTLCSLVFLFLGVRARRIINPSVVAIDTKSAIAPLDLKDSSRFVWHGVVLICVAILTFFLAACMAMYGGFLIYAVLRGSDLHFIVPSTHAAPTAPSPTLLIPHIPPPDRPAVPLILSAGALYPPEAVQPFPSPAGDGGDPLPSRPPTGSNYPDPEPTATPVYGTFTASPLTIVGLAVATLLVWGAAVVPAWAAGRFYRSALRLHRTGMLEFIPELSRLAACV